MKMHEDELDIDAGLVSRLVAAQFPELAALPVRHVRSTGTVNAIFRLGDDLYARLPRARTWAGDLDHEARWLPELAPRLTLPVPEVVGHGEPDAGYPLRWAIYRWIDGEPYADELVADELAAARELARFVAELRRVEVPDGAPRGGRRPLSELDAGTRATLEASRGTIDADAALAVWELALQGPPWSGTPVWIHTDLLRPNVLVRNGAVCAVIDFGGAGVGDPAADVIAAWSVFGPAGRDEFRRLLEVDDATWHRARGYALHQAAAIIPYYAVSNPGFVTLARRTVEQVLLDVTRERR
ncbi:MAG: aminoglycoside phosphotransferase family protein [Propionibacteriaceae bacterium]